MTRRLFVGAGCALALTLMIAGCGGGHSDNSNNDSPTLNNPGGGATADLSQLIIQPGRAASAFIDPGTAFILSFPTPAAGPVYLQASLHRYKEARGGESQQDYTVKVDTSAVGTATWSVRSHDGLDTSGVYYLDVRTSTDERRYAFVIQGDGRATPAPSPLTTAATGRATANNDVYNTGGNAAGFTNLQLQWATTAFTSAYIPGTSPFVLNFVGPNGAASDTFSPSEFHTHLYRYKEARGSDDFSQSEQDLEYDHTPGSGVWTFRRRGSTILESGTYLFVVTTPSESVPRRYSFIVQ